jgi:hypothetical protein
MTVSLRFNVFEANNLIFFLNISGNAMFWKESSEKGLIGTGKKYNILWEIKEKTAKV